MRGWIFLRKKQGLSAKNCWIAEFWKSVPVKVGLVSRQPRCCILLPAVKVKSTNLLKPMEAQYESLKKFPEGISKSFLYTVFRFCGNSNKNRLMPRHKLIFFFLFHLIRRSRKSKNQNQFIFNNLQKRHKNTKKCGFCFF